MAYPWQGLDPKDYITIEASQAISDQDVTLVTMVYKPIIKSDAFSLYLTLKSYIDKSSLDQADFLQSRLLAELGLGLADFYQARVRLEAMGLLSVYKNQMKNYIYTLHPPLSATSFFNEPLLCVLLQDAVGDKVFASYRSRLLPDLRSKEGYQNITKSFLDVYQVNPNKVDVKAPSSSTLEDKPDFSLSQADMASFDWDFLQEGLSKQLVSHDFLSEDIKEIIRIYHLTYGFNELEVRQAVLEAADLETGQVEAESLQKVLNRQVNRLGKANQLQAQLVSDQGHDQDKDKDRKGGSVAGDPVQEIIDVAKSMSPYDYLKSIKDQRHGIVSSSEKWLIKELMDYAKFPKEVLNILIHYILVVKNNTQVSKNFALKIADDWAQKGVTSAEDALEVIKGRYLNRQKNRQSKGKTWSKPAKRKGKQESRPAWMGQPNRQSPDSDPDQESDMRARLKDIMNREGGS